MPLDPAAERLLQMMQGARAPTGPRTITQRRDNLAMLMRFAKAENICPPGYDQWLSCGVKIRRYRPESAPMEALLPAIIFFHGGGLVAGSLETHDIICRGLCAASACCVIAVDYRLAPEHPFPAAWDDAIAASAEVLQRAHELGVASGRIALAGESGGAVLAIDATHQLGPGAVALLCLICPPVDFSMSSRSWQVFGKGYLLDREMLQADLADVTQGTIGISEPRLSPIHRTGLGRLPATIVHAAEFDPLRDEGDAFCALLRAAGVDVRHHLHEGLLHSFHAMGAVVPRGAVALTEIGVELGTALKAGLS